MRVLWSSISGEWETPPEVIALAEELAGGPFDLDAAATPENARAPRYYTRDDDALSIPDWEGKRIWLNPPYGRQVGRWVAKARQEASKGKIVVMLLPARTDTRWFHQYCLDARIVFLRGRLRFVGAKGPAPFPSMIVIFASGVCGIGGATLPYAGSTPAAPAITQALTIRPITQALTIR